MRKPTDLKNAAKTWQTKVEGNRSLLLRKSGHDVGWWAETSIRNTLGMRCCAEGTVPGVA